MKYLICYIAVAAFLESSNMPTADWTRGKTVIVVKEVIIHFLGSMLSIAMLELSIEVTSNW